MKTIYSITALLYCSILGLHAQVLTHGPIIGGVTNHTARVYVRTSFSAKINLHLYTSNENTFTDYQLPTDHEKDTSAIFNLVGLKASTEYHFKLLINSKLQQVEGSFKTFPNFGDKTAFSFTYGSCIEQNRTDSVFIEMSKQHPAFFLHLGDWTYPDHENYPNDIIGGKNQFYSLDFEKVKQLYRVRYSMPNMNRFMEYTPIDFIHDDDDFVFDGNSKVSQSGSYIKDKKTVLFENPLPIGARDNAIQGYMEFFPHYPIEHNTNNGLYHSFRYGNVEVFFLDSRANRSPENEAFKTKHGKLVFAPDTNHVMLGKEQMAWLLNGLKNSNADWKFIVSGTNFNMGYRRAIDLALLFQNREMQPGMTGGMMASSMDAMWVGYPYDQAKLINFCADEKIKNVVVLSGDAHSSSIDDGKNAGLPEMVAANLGVPNTKIPGILYNRIGLDLWDKGGQGIHNNNYNNCFGKVEVFGADSIQLNLIDQYGTIITSCVLHNGIVAKRVNVKSMAKQTAKTRFRKLGDLFRLVGHVIRHRKEPK